MDTHYDPATRRYYTVDETTGRSVWIEPPPPRPVQPPVAAWTKPPPSPSGRRVGRRPGLWIAVVGFLAVMGVIGMVNGGGDGSTAPTADSSTPVASTPASPAPKAKPSVVPAVTWIREAYAGAPWLDLALSSITEVRDENGMTWVYTKLYPKAENKPLAKMICTAVSAWQFDQYHSFRGVTVRAGTGDRLSFRMTVQDNC